MNVSKALEELFWAIGNAGRNAQRGIQLNEISKGTAEYIRTSVPGIKELSEEEHEVIEETVQFAVRFVDSYVSHHVENKKHRVDHEDHADQILYAAEDAVASRAISREYNNFAGKPASRHDQILKQLAIGMLKEFQKQFDSQRNAY